MDKQLAALAFLLAAVWAAPAHAQVVIVDSNVTSDTTWTADNQYLLRGAVFVQDGATLTIEPGTEIFGEQSTIGTLIISQGSQINAVGTAARPIVFSSDQEIGQRAPGDWGGLILNGEAPLNVPGGTATGEGDTGIYGGNKPASDCGTLSYVRVEYAGIEFSPDNELNGIAFQGCGSDTEVDHIQVHKNKDDGVEFFGGRVNAKYVLLTANADDSLDWTDGWQGKIQFLAVVQDGADADNGFEGDNNGENNLLTPFSNPYVVNFTLIGDPNGPESDHGMLIREGTKGRFVNGVVAHFSEEGLKIDQSKTFKNLRQGELSFASVLFDANGASLARFQPNACDNQQDTNDDADDAENTCAQFQQQTSMDNVTNGDAGLRDAKVTWQDGKRSNLRPKKNSRLLDGANVADVPATRENFFEQVEFVGAFDRRNKDDWTRRWTTWSDS